MQEIIIGSGEENMISYAFMGLVSGAHAVLRRTRDGWYILDNSRNGVFIGNHRISGSYKLHLGEQIDIFGLHLIFMDPLLIVGNNCGRLIVNEERLMPIEMKAPEHNEEEGRRELPPDNWFNRSPRNIPALYTDPIEIEAPPSPKQQKQRPAFMVIGPAFTMAIPMTLGCMMSVIASQFSGRIAGVFMYTGLVTAVGAAIIGAVWAVLNMNYTKKELQEDEEQRFNAYSNYLLEIAEKVKEQYRHNVSALSAIYPSAQICVSYGRGEPRLL